VTALSLSRLNLALTEHVKDARFELERAGSDPAKLAVWAAKWGEAAVARLLETSTNSIKDEGNGRRTPLT